MEAQGGMTAACPFADGNRQVAFYRDNCRGCIRRSVDVDSVEDVTCKVQKAYHRVAIGVPVAKRTAGILASGKCPYLRPMVMSVRGGMKRKNSGK